MENDSRSCTQCKRIKSFQHFEFNSKTNNYKKRCFDCVKKKRDYKKKNEMRIDAYQKKYRQENTESISKNKKEYYKRNIDAIRLNRKNKALHKSKARRNYMRNYRINRKNTDPAFKLRCNISTIIWKYLKNNKGSKNGHSVSKYLLYTIQELKIYLESLFESWMTWNNYGPYNSKTWNDNDQSTWTWNIDHIIPQSDLPFTSMDDENFKKCWSLDNLRPYSAKLNQLEGICKTRHNVNKDI